MVHRVSTTPISIQNGSGESIMLKGSQHCCRTKAKTHSRWTTGENGWPVLGMCGISTSFARNGQPEYSHRWKVIEPSPVVDSTSVHRKVVHSCRLLRTFFVHKAKTVRWIVGENGKWALDSDWTRMSPPGIDITTTNIAVQHVGRTRRSLQS